MTTLYKYQKYCTTDDKWVYGYGTSTSDVAWLTTHVDDTSHPAGHTMNESSVQEIAQASTTTVKIDENSGGTGEHYDTTTLVVTATANTKTRATLTFDHPVSALGVKFVTTSNHEGDVIEMYINRNSSGVDGATGSITADTAVATAWTSQNYTAGARVTNNSLLYTCTTNTVSSEEPGVTAGWATYWTEGYEITVSQTVIDNTNVGYHITLDDGTNSDYMGKVCSVDAGNLKIYVQNNATNTFASATPTYIRQAVRNITNWQIGPAWEYDLGAVKIGGSLIPKGVPVTLEYDNKHVSLEKTFIGIVEYLY